MDPCANAPLIDTHCHLDFSDYDADRQGVIDRAREAGVCCMISVGSTLEGSRGCVRLAREFAQVFATVGCHPHDAKDCSGDSIAQLRELARSPKVVAIGEIGLDYYRNLSDPQAQRALFSALLVQAEELGLPVVVHSRQASDDTIAILTEQRVRRVIVHCFGPDEKFLRQCLDRGYYVSFTCNVTYKKADALRSLVRVVPPDRFCLETDAPYLSPEGSRGKRNEPSSIRLLAEEIARIRGVTFEEIAAATTKNARDFFGLECNRP